MHRDPGAKPATLGDRLRKAGMACWLTRALQPCWRGLMPRPALTVHCAQLEKPVAELALEAWTGSRKDTA